MIDFEPAARQLTALLAGITDDQLKAPTPCPDYTLGDLLDHVSGLSIGFALAATKEFEPSGPGQRPVADAERLGEDWRARIPVQLDALVEAWRDPAAWQGMTRVGGVDLPGAMAGKFGLNELVVHGWDIARATGQPFDCPAQTLGASFELLSQVATPEGAPGLFGPIVDVPAEAPMVDRLIGLSGRTPAWSAS